MDGDVQAFAQVMMVIILSTASFVIIGLGARALWRVGSRPKARPAPTIDDARLRRLETAVDAVAVEVERISESQRFLVNLLAERLPGRTGERLGELPPAGGDRRTNTPR